MIFKDISYWKKMFHSMGLRFAWIRTRHRIEHNLWTHLIFFFPHFLLLSLFAIKWMQFCNQLFYLYDHLSLHLRTWHFLQVLSFHVLDIFNWNHNITSIKFCWLILLVKWKQSTKISHQKYLWILLRYFNCKCFALNAEPISSREQTVYVF